LQKQTFVRGTIILSISALLLKILGFFNSIFLTRLLGAEGIGLLMMAHPLVPLVITLTELGLPVAISKLVSEAEIQGNSSKVKRILVVSLAVTGTLSIILTLIALFGAKYIASIFITDQRAYYAMLAITPIAPIVAISAVLKGYFRGRQHMKTIAISEIIEHLVQMSFIFILIQLLLPYGIEYAVAGVMICSVIGEAAGLVYISAKFRRHFTNKGNRPKLRLHFRHSKQTLLELLHIGLPTTGNGFVHSIFRAFLPMLVTKSLLISGVSAVEATKQYGLLFGCAFPLLFLPSFITSSLSTALIPAISEAKATKNGLLMHHRMDQAMRTALLVGVPSTVILFLWADPLTTLIYHNSEAGTLLKILAPIFFLHYFEGPFHAILLGLGKASTVMWNFMVTSLFEAVAIFIFASKLGIEGVAIGLGFGVFLLSLLNFSSISSSIGFYMDIRTVWRTLISGGIMAICGMGMYSFMQHLGYSQIWNVLGAISTSLLAYAMALLVTKAFGHHQVINRTIYD
jgi:stage V sporulation protein B